jgi:outer membrane protein OmpA-like peptidoglycan-associated protein
VLADLKNASIIAKATARSHMHQVDHSPTAYYSDSPAWMKDSATEGYIKTCQDSKIGDAVLPDYFDGIVSAALTRQGIAAYDSGRYREALDLFTKALKLPAQNEFQVYSGLHIANVRLGRKAAANEFFGKLVDHGFAHKRLAMKFLFKPGSTTFWPDRRVSGSYSMWVKTIAKRTLNSNSCLEITGHSSPTGAEPLNERLSQQRAEYIEQKLEAEAPQLRGRTIASGAGSRENLVASGKDDLSDALDRRVVFQVHSCS